MEYGSGLALVKVPEAFLYEEDGTIADEVLSGWAVRLLEARQDRNGRVPVETYYGYRGWIDPGVLKPVTAQRLLLRETSGNALVVRKRMADLLAAPKVQGALLATYSRGSILEKTGEEKAGYLPVRAADGKTGYLAASSLMARRDSDGYVNQGGDDWFLHQKNLTAIPEETLRKQVVEMAESYLGVQYRWGGTSGAGIDCSGLVSMAYRLCGILIYRDAQIRPEYPIHEIPWEDKKPGDLLFMKGHVAMYLGEGRYLHSTGYARDFGCVYASLVPGAPGYREDLAAKWEKAGSLYPLASK